MAYLRGSLCVAPVATVLISALACTSANDNDRPNDQIPELPGGDDDDGQGDDDDDAGGDDDDAGGDDDDAGGDDDDDDDDDAADDDDDAADDDDDDAGDDDDNDDPKFDIGEPPDGTGDDDIDFSYIWIANTAQGTVSKIDTRMAQELARYRTGPVGQDLQPSRTSVNLQADVVVANRGTGSVVKFAAERKNCIDRNGNGSIETSSGPADILDWDADECMLWSVNPGFVGGGGGSRALAWDFAEVDGDDGPEPDPNVWVGFRNDPTDGHVVRLDGKTGAIEEDISIPDWTQVYGQGIYGGAIVPSGDFWTIGKENTVMLVDATQLTTQKWTFPLPGGWVEKFYGMTVEPEGNLWIGGQSGHLYEFDIETKQLHERAAVSQSLFGLAIDPDGIAWIAAQNPCAAKRFDIDAGVYLDDVPLPGCVTPWGASIDYDGNAWIVDRDANRAFKIDAETLDVTAVTGLLQPYTYSDMTGGVLSSILPPG